MKRFVRFVATAALGLLFVVIAAADTLELRDGRVLQGRYLGGTQAVLRFEVNGNVEAFSVNDVVAVTFTRGGGSDIFHASLETDVTVNGMLVARKGTDVYGRLAEAKEAGHIAGSSELQLALTRIVIDGRDYPVVSSDYTLQGKGRGKNTAEKVGGGAALGAIIGAIAGGGKGAAIGAGVGAGAGGAVQVLTRGQQVKVPSETLLEFRLQQPATVAPTGS